jgi:hypothetical protein
MGDSDQYIFSIFNIKDIFLFPIYYLIVVFFIKKYIKRKDNSIYSKYFLLGFKIKIAGLLLNYILTIFYFKGGGDTNLYFAGVTNIFDNFFNNPSIGFEQIFVGPNNLSSNAASLAHESFFFMQPPSINVVKIASLIAIFTFNSYLSISLFIGLYTFLGLWNIFKLANRYNPDNNKVNFIICFCLPTVAIWASGILKDPFSIGGFGFCLNYIDLLFSKEKSKIKNLLLVIINATVVLMTKDYTLYALLAAFFISFIISSVKKLPFFVKLITYWILIPTLFISLFLKFQANIEDYLINQVIEAAIEKQKLWSNTGGGSNYDLGTISPTLIGLAQVFPKSINVSIFRPYLWEVSNPLMLLEALLSSFFLVLLLYCFIRYGFLKSISIFFSNRFFITMLFYTIIFMFFVGLNTGNFGSLSRYRAPGLVTYLLLVFNTIHFLKIKKRQLNKDGTQ